MENERSTLERRIANLETAARRWRTAAVVLASLACVLVGSAFYATRTQQNVDAERITLRSSATQQGPFAVPGSRVELSVSLDGGLQLRFLADSAPRHAIKQKVELKLLDADGRDVARLGPPGFMPVTK